MTVEEAVAYALAELESERVPECGGDCRRVDLLASRIIEWPNQLA